MTAIVWVDKPPAAAVYVIDASCGSCGGRLTHEQHGAGTSAEQVVAARCTICRRQWIIRVTMLAGMPT